MELTLLTINTWKCDGDYYNRREVLKIELSRMNAQVILCQECFRSADDGVDTLGWLARSLEMEAWFVPARQKSRLFDGQWVDSFSALGILTSLPVIDQTVIELPSSAADGGRRAQLLEIGLPTGERLLIANIHLTHLPQEELRRQQLQTILDHMQRSDADFRLIGGDWNTEAGSPALNEFVRTTAAADCYVLGSGAEPRCTLLACHKKNLSVCVDHIYTLPFVNLSGYPSFIRAGVVLNEPDLSAGLYPSDHFGIRVTLTY